MLTFEQAAESVEDLLRADFPPEAGTFYVAPWGYQDAADYLVLVGAREQLLDNLPGYGLITDEQHTIDKVTGEHRVIYPLSSQGRRWRKAGDWGQAPHG